jgi:hypothetical protein
MLMQMNFREAIVELEEYRRILQAGFVMKLRSMMDWGGSLI